MSESRTNGVSSYSEPSRACGTRRCRISDAQSLRKACGCPRSPGERCGRYISPGFGRSVSSARKHARCSVRSCDRPGCCSPLQGCVPSIGRRSRSHIDRPPFAPHIDRPQLASRAIDSTSGSDRARIGQPRPQMVATATQPWSSARRCRSSSPAAGAVVRGCREPQRRRHGRRPEPPIHADLDEKTGAFTPPLTRRVTGGIK
jgi:hypothetical protein